MKLSVIAVLVLLALVGRAVADGDSKVVVLTPDNFDEVIESNHLSLVEFYAPWCGHCKALAPEYDQAAEEIDGQNVGILAKVDCTEHRDLCSKYDVRGFPTLKVFRNDGSEPGDYDQARKADAIVKFMKKQNEPAVTELSDSQSVQDFASEDSVKIVAFASSKSDLEAFTKVAQSMRNDYSFGATTDAGAASAQGVTAPAVVVFRDFDEGAVTYTGDINSVEDLTTFITAQSFPLVGEIGPENYAKYVERGLSFVWIFIDPSDDEHKALLDNAIKPVAKDHRADLSFVFLDGKRWGEHAKSFGLSGGVPGIVIEDRKVRKNYVFDEQNDVTEAEFRKYVSSYLDGSLAPTVKSEPVPESNDGPVTVVVGHTFETIVMDTNKDVFVEFYAPWCGHCKNLTPKYEELGEKYANDANMVIAKIDATANDSPADVQGFPTLIFYPAGDKTETVNYSGDRTAEAMYKWLEDNRKSKPAEAGHEEL